MVSMHANVQHLDRTSEDRKAVSSHRTLPSEMLDRKNILTPFREMVHVSLPYFEGSGVSVLQEDKPSSSLDFRARHPHPNTNPCNYAGEAPREDLLSQLEGGLAEQSYQFWPL